VAALAPLLPYPRGAPAGLPFLWGEGTVSNGLNFKLACSTGDLDTLGEIAGGGRYEDLVARSKSIQLFGLECLCLDLPALIAVKRAAGRPKDFEVIAELEALQDEDTASG
jgi:hypothetical protein